MPIFIAKTWTDTPGNYPGSAAINDLEQRTATALSQAGLVLSGNTADDTSALTAGTGKKMSVISPPIPIALSDIPALYTATPQLAITAGDGALNRNAMIGMQGRARFGYYGSAPAIQIDDNGIGGRPFRVVLNNSGVQTNNFQINATSAVGVGGAPSVGGGNGAMLYITQAVTAPTSNPGGGSLIYVDPTTSQPKIRDAVGNVFSAYANGYKAVADANYTALVSDSTIGYTSLTAARTVTLPALAAGLAGKCFTIKDEVGNAGSFNITINAASGKTIDGATSQVITKGHAALSVYWNGSSYQTETPASVLTGNSTDDMYALSAGSGQKMVVIANVMNAPYNAAGNAIRLTDVSMTSGTNIVHSVSYTFTTADIGKSITVANAGIKASSRNDPLWGYISGVTSGNAQVSTLPSGGSPVNASTTVSSGGWCHFGTDDTAAILACATAVAAAVTASGTPGMVVFPPGYNFLMYGNQNNVFNGVSYWGYGATVLQSTQAQGALFYNAANNQPLQGGAVTSDVGFYGLNIQGIGQYAGNYNVTGYDRYTPIALYVVNGCTVRDCTVDSFSTSGITFNQASAVKIIDNVVTNCCAPALNNAIHIGMNVAGTQTAPGLFSNDIEIAGNTVIGTATAAVCIQVAADNTTLATPSPMPYRARIHDNYLQTGDAFGAGWCGIALEDSTYSGGYPGHTIRDVTMHDNHIVCNTTNPNFTGGIMVVQDGGSPASTDPFEIDGIIIHDNKIDTNQMGMFVSASSSIIHNNIITSTCTNANHCMQLSTWSGNTNAPSFQKIHDNIFKMFGTGNTGNAITVSWAGFPEIYNNKIIYKATNTASNMGIYVNNASHPLVRGNEIQYPGSHGIELFTCSDAEIRDNRVYNPSGHSSGGAYGIYVSTCTATYVTPIEGNWCIDDRTTNLMYCGIFVTGGTPYDEIRHNRCFGGTYTSPSNGAIQQSSSCIGIGPNTTDERTPTLGFFYIPAGQTSPYTYQNTVGYPQVFGVMNNNAATGFFVEILRNTGTITIPTNLQSSFQEIWLDPGPPGQGGDQVKVTFSSASPTCPTMYVRPARQA